jgi:hypothetical protein
VNAIDRLAEFLMQLHGFIRAAGMIDGDRAAAGCAEATFSIPATERFAADEASQELGEV